MAVFMRLGALAIGVSVMVVAGPAFAHAGHAHAEGFFGGLAHPLTGWDHFAAMVAVGFWAANLGGRAIFLAPTGFVLGALGGALLAFAGQSFALVEPAILASVIVLAGLALLRVRAPAVVAAGLCALFGVAHGFAHGLEAPIADPGLYVAGFLLMTALLHVVGFGAGRALGHVRRPEAA